MQSVCDLSRNAFSILEAGYSDDISAVNDLLDDADSDARYPEDVLKGAFQNLTRPVPRLASEIGWLPELSASQRARALGALASADYEDLLQAIQHWPELAKANIAAHIVSCGHSISRAVAVLAEAWDEIDPAQLSDFINSERKSSGFPPATVDQVEAALEKLMGLHSRAAADAIWKRDEPGVRMNTLVERELERNSSARFLKKFVLKYDSRSEPALAGIQTEIDYTIEKAKEVDESLGLHVRKLSDLLNAWDEVNQPVQRFYQEQGQEEPRSKRVYENIRSLCVELANTHGRFNEAKQISEALLNTFPELESVALVLEKDVRDLDGLVEEEERNRPLAELIAACEEGKAHDLALVGELNRIGFTPRAGKPVMQIYKAFVAALPHFPDGDMPFLVIRDLALFLNNNKDNPEAAFKLLKGLLDIFGNRARNEVHETLKKERAVLHRNWKLPLLKDADGQFGEMKAIIDELLLYEVDPKDRQGLQQLRSGIARRQVGRWVKFLVFGGIAALVVIAYLEETSRPSSRPSPAAPRTGAAVPSTTRGTPNPPVTANDFTETKPPFGSNLVLTKSQIRYCIFQGKRVDYMRPMAQSNSQIEHFNGLVDDYNRRCSSFRYYDNDLQAVQSQAIARDATLRLEARRLVASW